MNVEASFLATLVRSPELIQQLRVSTEEFTSPQHKVLYKGLWELLDGEVTPDYVTLSSWVSRAGLSEQLPEADLVGILDSPGAAKNAEQYRHILIERSRARQMVEAAQAVLEKNGQGDPLDASKEFARISAVGVSNDKTLTQAMADMLDGIEERSKVPDGITGIRTGMACLDEAIGGWQPSDLNVIAARSGSGKTAFLCNSIRASNEPVGVISGEQPAEQLAMRIAAQHSNIDLRDMRTGKLSEKQYEALGKAVADFHDRPVFIHDDGCPTIESIEANAYRWAYREGVKTIWVDFIQMVEGGNSESGWERLGDYMRRMKGIAKDLGITFNVLSQVKAKVDERGMGDDGLGRMPNAQDVAESSRIEQAADCIITLYRPGQYEPRNAMYRNKVYFNICKNRHGPLGYRRAIWVGRYTKMLDWDDDLYQRVLQWEAKKT